MKIYYHYFEDKRLNGFLRGKYVTFLGNKVLKIKLFRLFTIYEKGEEKQHENSKKQ